MKVSSNDIKKIPLGLSSFKEIIQEDYYYIDKTEYIEKIENANTKFPILLRPRRFGKTLFADMLQTYYDINEKDNFDKLFKETYIGRHKTKLANSYYVLHLNLSGLDSRDIERLEYSFGAYVKEEIKGFLRRYRINEIDINDEEDFVVYTNIFLSRLRDSGKKLYIIIDEYDHFANSLLSSRRAFEDVTSKDGFVRSFYEVLKKHTTYVIDRIFITGVTSLTLDSLTSGFNISKNISNRKDMNGALGFTQDEVVGLVDYMQVPDRDKTLETLKENYNGYLFSGRAEERVYNSNMILYYMDEYAETGASPEELADPNIVGDYNKLSAMLDLYKNEVDKEEILQDLMANESVSGKLVTSFSLITEFTRDHFLSLLYYLGLLTMEKGGPGKYQYKTPNNVIKAIYYDYYFEYLKNALNITDVMINEALSQFEDNMDISPVIKIVENIIIESTRNNNRYMIHFRENTLQTLFYMVLRQSNKYNVFLEYREEKNYIDILYKPIHKGKQYIIELKYISQSKYDNDEKVLDQLINDVQRQIQKSIRSMDDTKGIAIIFKGKECSYSELIG